MFTTGCYWHAGRLFRSSRDDTGSEDVSTRRQELERPDCEPVGAAWPGFADGRGTKDGAEVRRTSQGDQRQLRRQHHGYVVQIEETDGGEGGWAAGQTFYKNYFLEKLFYQDQNHIAHLFKSMRNCMHKIMYQCKTACTKASM